MKLLQIDQMFLIVPKFEWSCFNLPKYDQGCWNLRKRF